MVRGRRVAVGNSGQIDVAAGIVGETERIRSKDRQLSDDFRRTRRRQQADFVRQQCRRETHCEVVAVRARVQNVLTCRERRGDAYNVGQELAGP